jgi:hypothetical protein
MSISDHTWYMEGTNSVGEGILQRMRLRHFSGNLLAELAEPTRRVGWLGTHTAEQTAVRSSPLRFQVPEGDRVEGEGPVESMDENLNQLQNTVGVHGGKMLDPRHLPNYRDYHWLYTETFLTSACRRLLCYRIDTGAHLRTDCLTKKSPEETGVIV